MGPRGGPSGQSQMDAFNQQLNAQPAGNPGYQNRSMNMPPSSGAGGYPPGGLPNPNTATTSPSGRIGGSSMDDFMSQWGSKYNKGYNWADEGLRNAAEGEANYYRIPMANAMTADATRRDNMDQFRTTHGETVRNNDRRYSLDERGSAREDQAMAYGQANNERDYGEFVRQGDRQYGLDERLGVGNMDNDRYGRETDRMSVGNTNLIQQEQNRLREYEAFTGRQDVEGRQRLEGFANDTARMRAEGQNTNERYGVDTQRELGLGANANARYGVDVQRELGQGDLGYKNRQLDTDEAYRRSALAQEGAIARERMATDSMNQRYATFGRAQAPSTRAMRSFN
jgi:hypothetical protein